MAETARNTEALENIAENLVAEWTQIRENMNVKEIRDYFFQKCSSAQMEEKNMPEKVEDVIKVRVQNY